MTREEMAIRLDSYKYPSVAGLLGGKKVPPVLKKKYRQFIEEELGIKTKEDLDALRTLAANKIMRMQNEVLMKAKEDLHAGRYQSLEQMPLYRAPSKNGNSHIMNIPPELLNVMGFITYINETWEWKYGNGGHTVKETMISCMEDIQDFQRRAPLTAVLAAVSSGDYTHVIMDKSEDKNLMLVTMMVQDYVNNASEKADRGSVISEVLPALFDNIREDVMQIPTEDYDTIDSLKNASDMVIEVTGQNKEYEESELVGIYTAMPGFNMLSEKAIHDLFDDMEDRFEDSELSGNDLTSAMIALSPVRRDSVIRSDYTNSRYLQLMRKILACTLHASFALWKVVELDVLIQSTLDVVKAVLEAGQQHGG